ncbi:hypothetical protein FGO68_gene8491 [Halteria grandinella]|uniref:Protein-tyrosine-phosphatase n=1 Tax=Halteria grandinella TaxID=5974 RepID=A0A8J8NRK7_HALGN|nr:hypothetical protein FGO68_gene8491 [Halteria grandinella]
MDQIIENLYLGDLMVASSKEVLQKYGITHILTVAKGHPPPFPSFFTYKVVPVLDLPSTKLRPRFPECIDFIKLALDKGGKVFVHCFAGVSRSATVIIAYLMQEHGLAYHAAYKLVKSKRPVICPNDGFRVQLVQFQKEIKDKQSATQQQKLEQEMSLPNYSTGQEYFKENISGGAAAMQLSKLIKETLIADNIPGFHKLSSKTGKSIDSRMNSKFNKTNQLLLLNSLQNRPPIGMMPSEDIQDFIKQEEQALQNTTYNDLLKIEEKAKQEQQYQEENAFVQSKFEELPPYSQFFAPKRGGLAPQAKINIVKEEKPKQGLRNLDDSIMRTSKQSFASVTLPSGIHTRSPSTSKKGGALNETSTSFLQQQPDNTTTMPPIASTLVPRGRSLVVNPSKMPFVKQQQKIAAEQHASLMKKTGGFSSGGAGQVLKRQASGLSSNGRVIIGGLGVGGAILNKAVNQPFARMDSQASASMRSTQR